VVWAIFNYIPETAGHCGWMTAKLWKFAGILRVETSCVRMGLVVNVHQLPDRGVRVFLSR
jgi:hypothetical protein